jgi:hypothetical protein
MEAGVINTIFTSLPECFVKGSMNEPASYYFSLGPFKKTVRLSGQECLVEEGRTVDDADCVCKTSPEFFMRIWLEGYRPGMADFLSGTIKSNNPGALQVFLRAFAKEA